MPEYLMSRDLAPTKLTTPMTTGFRLSSSAPSEPSIEPSSMYKCRYGECGKSFSRLQNCERHENIHSRERLWPCKWPSCERLFTQEANLKSHMRTHTGEKPYSCDRCNLTFSQKATLQRHRLKHEGKRFFCPEESCPVNYARKAPVKKHFLSAHGGRFPEIYAQPAAPDDEGAYIPYPTREASPISSPEMSAGNCTPLDMNNLQSSGELGADGSSGVIHSPTPSRLTHQLAEMSLNWRSSHSTYEEGHASRDLTAQCTSPYAFTPSSFLAAKNMTGPCVSSMSFPPGSMANPEGCDRDIHGNFQLLSSSSSTTTLAARPSFSPPFHPINTGHRTHFESSQNIDKRHPAMPITQYIPSVHIPTQGFHLPSDGTVEFAFCPSMSDYGSES